MSNRASPAKQQDDGLEDHVRRFIEELNEAPEIEHVLFGMVRPADERDGLMFAHLGGCGEWIHIPASSIARIDGGAHVPCRGHYHVTARIRLKPPETDHELTLSNVAALHLSRLNQLVESRMFSASGCGKDQHVVTDSSGVQHCVDNQSHGPFGGIA
jgi:hypothetical protein